MTSETEHRLAGESSFRTGVAFQSISEEDKCGGSGQLVQDEEIHALQRETKNLTLERASNKHEEKVLRA